MSPCAPTCSFSRWYLISHHHFWCYYPVIFTFICKVCGFSSNPADGLKWMLGDSCVKTALLPFLFSISNQLLKWQMVKVSQCYSMLFCFIAKRTKGFKFFFSLSLSFRYYLSPSWCFWYLRPRKRWFGWTNYHL